MTVSLVEYEVSVLEVHSGDDLMLMVNLGIDGLYKKVRARLYGVDTPDAYRSTNSTKAGEVRDQVRAWVSNKQCRIKVHSTRKGGWIVTLEVHAKDNDYLNVNERLIKQGFVYQPKIA